MRAVVAMGWLVAAGCNAVFGLERTGASQDFFDAAPDAPFACPGFGELPRYKRKLVQVAPRDCYDFTVSQRVGIALATCREPAFGYYSGALDGELVPALGLAQPTGEYLEAVMLAADGDLAVGRACDFQITACRFATFARTADGTWAPAPDLPIPMTFSTRLTPLALGPDRRVFLTDNDDGRYEEWAEGAGGAWTRVATYTLADLGVVAIYNPTLAPDALRMIAYARTTGEFEMFYFDRPSRDARFGAGRPLDLAAVPEMHITEDCARLYFTALRSVFYVERE